MPLNSRLESDTEGRRCHRGRVSMRRLTSHNEEEEARCREDDGGRTCRRRFVDGVKVHAVLWRRGKSMVSLVNSHTNATRIGWHLWEIDLRFASGLPPGWTKMRNPGCHRAVCSRAPRGQKGAYRKCWIIKFGLPAGWEVSSTGLRCTRCTAPDMMSLYCIFRSRSFGSRISSSS